MDQESPSGGEQWHELSPKRVATILDTNLEGLSVAEAARRLQASGPNELQALDTPGPLSLFLKQLANPLIIMLLIAAGVSFLARHPVDGVVILLVVVFECVIGTVQEWRAERALEALEQLAAPHARVVRDAEVRIVDAADVVPGDVLQLETGDRIAADVRLVETAELAIDESAFTGESDPVEKRVAAVCAETPTPDRLNMAWASTTVTRGRGLGLVVETGMRTAIGRIAEDVQTTRREATPLQKRLGQLAVFMGFIAIGAAVAIFVLGMLRGFALVEMLLFAVAAAVSAVPEGLPAVVTVVLAAGVQRMSRRNAIIRRLPAVETLGSTTVVCSDKTGTITRNQMTVRRIWTGDGAYRLEGDGFEPVGAILDDSDVLVDLETAGPSGLRLLLLIGLLANNAILELEGSEWKVQGNPTDGALLVAGHKAHLHLEELEVEHERLDEIPLSSTHKYAATLHEWDGAPRLLVKGAPERLLKASTHLLAGDGPRELTDALRSTILQASDELAGQGLRVIAGACRDLRDDASDANRDDAESDLVFVGMWGLLDPPRDDAITAIAAARRAGMRVVMITGDHASTAMAIARAVGIADHDEQAVSGEDLDSMSDSDLEARVGSVSVYARVEPEHKLRIVTALKSLGETVAMTGDGVNDAPALKSADVGIAMGITGTEVARQAADIVLADDNFATIIDAVEEGRVIFSNLRRVVAYLITTTAGELMTLFGALALGLHLPVTAVMILWINLVADGVSSVPLGLEPKHVDVLTQPPRPHDEGVLSRLAISRIVVLAAIAAGGTLLLFVWESQTKDLAHAQTIAFTTLVAFEWFKSVTWRTSNESVFSVGLLSNRWLVIAFAVAIPLQLAAIYTPIGQLALGTVPLGVEEWTRVIIVASSVLVLDEIGKLIRRRIVRARAS